MQRLIPAAAAAAAAFLLGGSDGPAAASAALLAGVILSCAALLRDTSYPHRLMPVSRMIVSLLPAMAGMAAAALIGLAGVSGRLLGALVAAAAIAAIAALVVETVGRGMLELRPLRIAVLGSAEFAAALKRELRAGSAESVEVVGWLGVEEGVDEPVEQSQIGALDSIRAAVTEHEIDLLVRGSNLAGESSGVSDDAYQTIAQECLDLPVRLVEGNQLFEQLFGHVPIGTIGSSWFLYLTHPSFEGTPPSTKRIFDLVGAAVLSVFALPLVAIAAAAIRLEGPGSVLYRQRRVGEGGREYEILKLRTMVEDSEPDGAQWSLADDPRVTRVGRFLRRSHIDELPQLLNVLRGDMTLVGPRPERPEIIAELETLMPHYNRRLLVKPGVTGWAQVRCGYAGSELGTAWKLSHDLFYLKHRGLLADALIVVETMAVAARDSHRPMRAPQAEFLFGSGRLESPEALRRSIAGPDAAPSADSDPQPVPKINAPVSAAT